MLDTTTLTVKIKNRLGALGYNTLVTTDDTNILYLIEKVGANIKHWCNIDEIPECLEHVVIERVCGEFLLEKASFNQLDESIIEPLIKSTKLGDTEINYQVGATTPLDILRSQCKNLTSYGLSDLKAHRRLVW